ncbi:MAG: hypothetical protein ACERKD_14750 [Prolixibacteraceae bacterium]
MLRSTLVTFLIALFITSIAISTSAQKTIKGHVLGFQKYPLTNVTVESKKSKQLVKTDSLGFYTIQVSDKDKIQFKTNGFYSIVYKTNKEDTIDVNLIYIDTKNSFSSVIENQVMAENDLSEALENYSDNNNNFFSFQNIFDVVQSVYPSVVVDDTSSPIRLFLPGKGSSSNQAGHEALLVVNQIRTFDISDISPVQVKKVKVLTGNEASMLYGTQGSNGVIEIELKD